MTLFNLLTPEAVEPTRSTRGSVGYDLTATELDWDETGSKITYRTGVGIGEVPEGYFAALFPRSSIAETNLRLANSVGVIDTDYTGEILVTFDCPLSAAMIISKGNARAMKVGDKIAQIVFLPFMIGGEISPTEERGDAGFGSTEKRAKKK